jgi:major vault protein
MPDVRDSEIVLAPNEFAFVFDQNNGFVQPSVGPTKRTVENTERTVLYNSRTGKYDEVPSSQAKQLFTKASERSYIVLENPVIVGDKEHPTKGKDNTMPNIEWGRKQNIPGPAMFPLWPGQIATVLDGHQLRSNEYLVCVVDNAQEAIKNWNKAVIDKVGPEQKELNSVALKTGQIIIIKGTEVSYYIPPTGISVIPDEENAYVRDAVTLERLEYAILLDENGNKRYEKGPAVVFPGPTEAFVEVDGKRKFNAIELNEQMGLYLKVTAEYGEGNIEYGPGDELFITGKNQKIYYPRPEHSIIKYGDKTRHYAIAIPKGEGRYVLYKENGEIRTVKGPEMFLPDPRKEVVVKRYLPDFDVVLWFPDSPAALAYNRALAQAAAGEKYVTDNEAARQGSEYLKSDIGEDMLRNLQAAKGGYARAVAFSASSTVPGKSSRDIEAMYSDKKVAGSNMDRGTSYTPPRAIILDTKYEGAVVINIWPGFAVQVVSKTGERKVVMGPQSVILDYDQTLETLSLSTGTPKDDEKKFKTVYLRVKENRVSDIIENAVTKDMVSISIEVNYRLNFEGDPQAWFSVSDYVKFLTRNLRSIIRGEIKKHTIQDVSDNVTIIIRDLILGKSLDSKREGRIFPENGMHVIDVEILKLDIGNASIKAQLEKSQFASVQNALAVSNSNMELESTRQLNKNEQETIEITNATETKRIKDDFERNSLKKEHEKVIWEKFKEAQIAEEEVKAMLLKSEVARGEATVKIRSDDVQVDVNAFKEKMAAITPRLIEAIESAAQAGLAKTYVENIPKSGAGIGMLVGGKLIENIIAVLGTGSPLADALKSVVDARPSK